METKPFLAFQIEPTSRCQLRCTMCPRTAFSGKWESGDMSLLLYEKISKFFHLFEHVHLQGWGEPLLHPHLFDMIKIAKDKGCKVSLTTNGVLLNHILSQKIIAEGLDTLAISIAGAFKNTHEGIRKGSNLEQLVDNIKVLSKLKTNMQSKTPKLVLSFLMTKTNINELPDIVDLAKDVGISDLVATNLDYTPTEGQDELKAFSCSKATNDFKILIKKAERKAKKVKLSFRVYPLEMEEVIMCEMNPLKIVFISHDGCVSPCVYLNMANKGLMTRIFCGSYNEIKRVCFGDMEEGDFMKIWESTGYRNFRTAYVNRMKLLEKGHIVFDFSLTDTEREIKRGLAENPLPDVCKTCYKAYGV